MITWSWNDRLVSAGAMKVLFLHRYQEGHINPILHCAGVHRGEDPGGGGGQGAGVEGGQARGRGRVGLHGAGRYI